MHRDADVCVCMLSQTWSVGEGKRIIEKHLTYFWSSFISLRSNFNALAQ